MKKPALSATMIAALELAREYGSIVRYQGGFWTRPDAGWNGRAPDHEWFGTSTIEACVKRGAMRYTEYKGSRNSNRFPVAAQCVESAEAT